MSIKNERSQSYRDTKGPGKSGIKNMLQVLERRNDKKGIRDIAVVTLFFSNGLRSSELLNLDLDDLDLETGTLKITGKGKRDKDEVKLPEITRVALAKWLVARGSEQGPLLLNMGGQGRSQGE